MNILQHIAKFTRLAMVFLFTLSLLLISRRGKGQDMNRDPSNLRIYVDSSIVADNGSLVALTVNMTNQGVRVIGNITLRGPEGVSIIGDKHLKVSAEQMAKTFYPLRLSVGKNVPAGRFPLVFGFLDTAGNPLAETVAHLTVPEKRLVHLYAQEPQQWIKKVGDSLRLAVILRNEGNTEERLRLQAALPDGKSGLLLANKEVLLSGFQDTILYFNQLALPEWFKMEQFTAGVSAFYEKGGLINTVLINVQNVSGNKTFIAPNSPVDLWNLSGSNEVSLSTRNLFSGVSSWQLNGKGRFQLPAGSMAFSLDALYWGATNSRPMITNTYLNYELNNKGITFGNITENLETFVSGRGIKAYIGREGTAKQFEIAAVDKSYNLLGNGSGVDNAGYTAYARTVIGVGPKRTYEGSVFFDKDNYDQSNNALWINKYNWETKSHVHVGLDAGGGLSWQDQSLSSAAMKPSLALGIRSDGKLGTLVFSTENYYSSGFYPGTKRGLFQLNERLSHSFGKTNVWMNYQLYRYHPSYWQDSFFAQNESFTSTGNIGLAFPVAKHFNVNLSAENELQKGDYALINPSNERYSMNAYRLNEWLSWYSRNSRHQVYLAMENGWATSPLDGSRIGQIRLNGSWVYGSFSFNAFLQKGDFTLFEALYNPLYQQQTLRFNLSPNIQHRFFNNKLNIQAGVMYTYDSFSGRNWAFSGSGSLDIGRKTAFFINSYLYAYQYKLGSTTSSTVRFGITQRLPGGNQVNSARKGNVEIFCFFDLNNNGYFDGEDRPANERILYVDRTTFLTGEDGLVHYKDVPYGEYVISLPSQNWYCPVKQLSVAQRKVRLDIPLQQIGRVNGMIDYHYDELLDLPITEKQVGVRFWIKGANGFNEEVLTNDQGRFFVSLPVGDYTAEIDPKSLPLHVYVKEGSVSFQVKQGIITALPVFELEVEKKKVNIKKFN